MHICTDAQMHRHAQTVSDTPTHKPLYFMVWPRHAGAVGLTVIVGFDDVGPPTLPVHEHPAIHAGMKENSTIGFTPFETFSYNVSLQLLQ